MHGKFLLYRDQRPGIPSEAETRVTVQVICYIAGTAIRIRNVPNLGSVRLINSHSDEPTVLGQPIQILNFEPCACPHRKSVFVLGYSSMRNNRNGSVLMKTGVFVPRISFSCCESESQPFAKSGIGI